MHATSRHDDCDEIAYVQLTVSFMTKKRAAMRSRAKAITKKNTTKRTFAAAKAAACRR
jgi:hypothetical protein